MQRLHAIVSGRVQGVFFRASTRDKAGELQLTGWVKNRPDGTVELIAEGPKEALEALATWCHEGPPRASVTGVDPTFSEATGEFDSFSIQR